VLAIATYEIKSLSASAINKSPHPFLLPLAQMATVLFFHFMVGAVVDYIWGILGRVF
jgi:hypothetical protein